MLDIDFKLKNWRWNTTQPFTTWVTEFNMIEQKPYTINNTWAHGLLVSSQINQLLKKTKAEMFHFHSIGAESFPVFSALKLMTKDSTYLQPTTSGIVTAMWNKLTHNAEQLYQININKINIYMDILHGISLCIHTQCRMLFVCMYLLSRHILTIVY